MADNVISNLSIEVTASADKAASVFDRLASSAGRLRGAASGAAGGMQDMAQGARDAGTATATAGEQAGQAQPRIRGVGNAAKDAGDNAKKGASGLATFWQSLKRIAFYRFIRSIIKEITEAFKEGITNLYHWSAAVNGTFAKSMDRIATSTLYLKNSLGAMLAPLINTLAPVIEWIIDRIVDVINWINKLFAALSGSQTYTVAKKVATTWADAGKSAASSAKKAADDIKRTILGFDEINKLEKQNTSSYGGGSGSASSVPNYNDMFEERRLDGWMSKLASFIDKFKLQIPAVFGALLAGWAAVKFAIEGVAKLSLGWLKDMAGKAINIAVSLFRKGWTTIKNWALSFGEAAVDMAVRIKTSVLELWGKLATAWAALNPVLKVGIAISITAAALWALYKLAWALVPDKMLQVEVAIKTAAVTLKNGLVKAWNNLAAWSLGVGVKIVTTANALKESLVRAWNNLAAWSLSVGVKIATTANALKTGLVNAWNGLAMWSLGVAAKIATSAAKLKNDIINAWNKLTDWALGVKLRIETKLADLWQWVKNNWKIVAAAALGVAIAIATPWSAIAAALSSLWADVMASFGGSLAFAVTPTLNPTGNYGLGWTPEEFNSKQEEIKNAANELRGSFTASSIPKNTPSTLLKDLLGVGGVAAAVGLISNLVSGGASSALASVFMPGVSSAADKSKLSPKTSYYNNATGELVIPKSANVNVNFTAADNKSYKNSTLGKWLVDAMEKVKPQAVTTVSSVAGKLTKIVSDKILPDVGGTTTINTVNSVAGVGTVQNSGACHAVVNDTATSNTVNAVAGYGMSGTNSYSLSAIVSDTDSTNTVHLDKGWYGSATWALGLDNLDSTAWVDADTPWWHWHKSALDWLGLSNLSTVVSVSAKVVGSAVGVLGQVFGGRRANGGVYSGGRWSDIPQYAGGKAGVNHGSLFWAGENGAEIVGNAGGRTEVLNKSQIASAMYSAVQAAMAPAAANFADAAANMGVAGTGFDFETLADMVRQGVEQAMSRSNDYDRQKVELLRSINDKDFNVDVSTASINKAQSRMNRRAGVTIAPVGT